MLKNEDFGFDIFKKGQILRPFSGRAPSNLKKKILTNLMVAYVHIEYFYLPIFRRIEGGD